MDGRRQATEHAEARESRARPRELETTHSPESPTAWASFATGRQRREAQHLRFSGARHGDLHARPRDGPPRSAALPPQLHSRSPAPTLTSIRRRHIVLGHVPGRRGVRSSVLTVPVTFPPENVPNGELLSGLPLPDIRGTMGTFSYYGSDLNRYEEGDTEMGGLLKRLVFDADVALTELVGPPNPIVRQQLREARATPHPTDADKTRIADLLNRASSGRGCRSRSIGTRPARRRRSTSATVPFICRRVNGASGSTSTSRSTCSCACTGWRSCI